MTRSQPISKSVLGPQGPGHAQPVRGERQVRAVSVLMVCLSGLACVGLALRSVPALFVYPLQEDGYIALAIARWIGLGHGVTYDGHTLTNGFQPLWVFLCAPLFALTGGDRMLSCRLVVLVQTMIFGLTGLMLYRVLNHHLVSTDAGSRRTLAWLATALFLCSREVWLHAFSGMETGLLLLGYVSLFRLYQVLDFSRRGSYAILGAAMGLLVLIRIDTAFFVVSVCGLHLVTGVRQEWRGHWLKAAITGGMAGLVSAPWWIFNVTRFGSLMPSSGQATGAEGFSGERLGLALGAVLKEFASQAQVRGLEGWRAGVLHGALVLGVGAIIGWRFRGALRSYVRRHRSEAGGLFIPLGGLLCTTVLLVVWYSSRSSSVWFYPRYFAFVALLGCGAMAVAIRALSERVAFLGPLVLCCVLLGYGKGVAYAFHSFSARGLPHREANLFLVNKHVPAVDLVGAGQVGVLGFFRGGVVNLDGKVNGEANRFRGRIQDLLDRHQINWVCDSPGYLKGLGFDPDNGRWSVIEELEGTTLYRRR